MGSPVIVCFVGGTAGDIITQILDPQELTLTRQQLKKPHVFANDTDKDLFLATTTFTSIPSHDFDYHCKRKHNILGIVCRHFADAQWAAHRFKKLHRPHVWSEMTAFCGADTEDAYAQAIINFGNMVANYTTNVVYLDKILTGHAVAELQAIGYQTPGQEKYKKWLVDNEINPTQSDY
jgi:hypothetical protein